MSYQHTKGCPGLPKGWWWLLAISGLALLYFLMLSSRQQPIENALQAQVNEALAEQGMGWAAADLQRRGRDVLLSGTAPDEAAKAQAMALAGDISGVRTVDSQITIAPPVVAAPLVAAVTPEIEILKTAEGVTLKGVLGSQAEVDALIDTTAATLGDSNIMSEVEIAESAGDSPWLSKVPDMLSIVSVMPSAALNLSARFGQFSGVAATAQQKAKLINDARKVLGDQMVSEIEVIPNIAPVLAVNAPSIESAPLAASEAEGQLTTKEAKFVVSDTETEAAEKNAASVCQSRLDDTIAGKRILFGFNDAKINVASYPLLDQIAEVAEDCSAVLSNKGLEVSGYTDNIGRQSYNQMLSQQRARAVKEYLVKAGLPADLVASRGLGENQPVASNATPEGRAKNRRIEFTIKTAQE
ncbi:MAG: OmpA family protein [Thiotrichales bacterium]